MKKLISTVLFSMLSVCVLAGGIKGKITNKKGERMPFTSVIVRGQSSGTMANGEGEYLLNLKAGNYEIAFQFLGYKTESRKVTIADDFQELNVTIEEQNVVLKEVKVSSKDEDPAYTIMRKAIAKSKIHQKQIVDYQAKAYVKNSILLNNIPFMFKKEMAKQNIKENVPFVSESVMDITYKQPNTKYTKVVGQKSTFDGVSISDGFYLFDFYTPGQNRVSPLSPLAFKYYNFEYEGFFEDRGLIINKIKLIPKSYGDGVWKGTIYIIDGYWNIHSISVETVDNGLNLQLSQYYGPIQKVWIPINQRIDFFGKVLGFDFSIKAQVNANYLSVTTNPAFVEEIKLIDEVKEGKIQETFTKKSGKLSKAEELLKEQKEFSLKNIQKLMKAYEKEERKRLKENNQDVLVISNDSIWVDSLATKRDSTFWKEVRSTPLTAEEIRSYSFGDSIKIAKVEKRDSLKKDSLNKAWRNFLVNNDFKLKNNHYLHFEPPYMPFAGLNYNSVEGIVADLGLGYKNYNFFTPKNKFKYNYFGNIRYAFHEKALRGRIGVEFEKKSSKFTLGVGKYIAQFDPNSYIFEWMNSITTLFYEQNFLKLYDKKYVNVGYSFEKDVRFNISSNVEIAQRTSLDNLNKIYVVKDISKNAFSTNNPPSIELGEASFQQHIAVIWQTQAKWNPSTRITIKNGVKRYLTGKAPIITLTYKKGMLDANFDYLSLNIKQTVSTGQFGKLDYMVEGGDFVNDKKVYLMDLKHLNNNYLNAFQTGLFARFRLLNTRTSIVDQEGISYANPYKFSTKGIYLQAHVINEFKKFIITQIPFARVRGLKEDLFVNYLNSPTLKNYVEAGYGIDGFLKVLRLEVITSFEEGKYQRWGVKVGVTM